MCVLIHPCSYPIAVSDLCTPSFWTLELTKRLGRAESAAAGLPAEDAAEEDLLDTAWVQRLRRISQLQSARWVFPTAEHSRFTHGLGVMHEAGAWIRLLVAYDLVFLAATFIAFEHVIET